MPNFVISEGEKSKKKERPIKRRNMKNVDPTKFQSDINNSILCKIDLINDAEKAYNYFHSNFLRILDEHAPYRYLTKKGKQLEQKPWITKGLLTSIRKKAKVYI